MNAGAHGREIKDVLISACVVDANGGFYSLNVTQLGYAYRQCSLPKDWTFVSAKFQGMEKPTTEIQTRMQLMLKCREKTQPVKERTAGCTFANPVEKSPAWKLIQDAGCQGKQEGGAEVSKKHCNFLINFNSATAEELESLGEAVQSQVYATSGVALRWEIERIGVKLDKGN